MCYVCNCFSWTLDLLQRGLTLILSCWLTTAVCCGLFIATMAGIAYGYNYSMAEFITLTRSDVNVYMRRGQFYERPDFQKPKRRIGEDDDIFPYNLSDYQQEVPLGDDSLADKWKKDQDTKKYAEKLTKYSEEKPFIGYEVETTKGRKVHDSRKHAEKVKKYTEEKTFTDSGYETETTEESTYKLQTPTPPTRVSIIPFHIISTTIMHSGSSEIIMRKFDPLPNIGADVDNEVDRNDDYGVEKAEHEFSSNAIVNEDVKRRETVTPDIRIRVEDSPIRHSILMRHWETTETIMSDIPEVDEDAVVYRAV